MMKKMTISLLVLFMVSAGEFVAGQNYRKEIRMKKIISGNDTIITYDTIEQKGHPDTLFFGMSGDWFENELERALAPLRDSNVFHHSWEQSMQEIDSLRKYFDIRMNMNIDPPAFMFYFDDGEDSVIREWSYGGFDEFEQDINALMKKLNEQVNRHLGYGNYLKNSQGDLSGKLQLYELQPGLYDLQILNPLTIRYIKVYSAAGRLVFYQYVPEVSKNKSVVIDLRKECPGDYFLEVISDNDWFLKRLTL
jgi:hypothetical protein